MIIAVHALLYSREADAARAFFRDVLRFDAVDAGGGWPIFALPPGEIAVHPAEDGHQPELYLVCDDIDATLVELRARNVEVLGPVSDQGWGRVTRIRIAPDVELGIYEPRHPLAAKVREGSQRKPKRRHKRTTRRKG